jgi:hypothetical protein
VRLSSSTHSLTAKTPHRRLTLGDGEHTARAFLHSQNNALVNSGAIAAGNYVRIVEWHTDGEAAEIHLAEAVEIGTTSESAEQGACDSIADVVEEENRTIDVTDDSEIQAAAMSAETGAFVDEDNRTTERTDTSNHSTHAHDRPPDAALERCLRVKRSAGSSVTITIVVLGSSAAAIATYDSE